MNQKPNLPRVVLVGRANVGKSTLFNRLTETQKAIVSPLAGTTRNAIRDVVAWNRKRFLLLDSGGLLGKPEDAIEKAIDKETKAELGKAQVILLVVDVKSGVLPTDRAWARELRTSSVPIIVVTNKADNARLRAQCGEFQTLGLGHAIPVSATNGSGTGDLLDEIAKLLPDSAPPFDLEESSAPAKIAIVGRPNVGKSSLFNLLSETTKSIVSPIPHTTRDVQVAEIQLPEQMPARLMDTAGMRRRKPRFRGLLNTRALLGLVESQSVRRATAALERAHIVLLVLDITEPAADQDKSIARMIAQNKRAAIVLLNKIDLLDDRSPAAIQAAGKWVHRFFPHLRYAPLIPISCTTKEGVDTILPLISRVRHAYYQNLDSAACASVLDELRMRVDTPKDKVGARAISFLDFEQTDTAPPIFTLTARRKTTPPAAIFGLLEKILRDRFDFIGSPLVFKTKSIKNL